jgi:hypothetical protein
MKRSTIIGLDRSPIGYRRDGRPIYPIRGADPRGTVALLQRLSSERQDVQRNIDALNQAAVDGDGRDLTDAERELVERHTTRLTELDAQIGPLLAAEEAVQAGADIRDRISRAANGGTPGAGGQDGTPGDSTPPRVNVRDRAPAWLTADPRNPDPALMRAYRVTRTGREYQDSPYRTFAEFARDAIVARHTEIAARAGGSAIVEAARDRLTRVPPNTLTTDVAGLLPGTHMAQIMDVIDNTRPLVASARPVELENGKLTYPKIATRPTVGKQATQKTEATPYTKLAVTMESMQAEVFLGAGDLSWQTINWATPSALELWFDLCAEDYARKTEAEAGTVLTAGATNVTELPGATGTAKTFDQWWAAIIGAAQAVYTQTGSRVMPNTIWASPNYFFALLGVMSSNGTAPAFAGQGSLDLPTLRGNVGGLTLVGTPGLPASTMIVGDARALLVAEQPGNPVELRAVEPSIAGMEVGLIGAFIAKVFDANRFHKIVDAT